MRPPRPATTPSPETKVVTATAFKTKVAAYLRYVERTGATLIITNRGRHTATITSGARRPGNTFIGAGRGAIRVPHGSTPFTTLPSWNAATQLPAESASDPSPATPRLLTDGQPSAPPEPPQNHTTPTDHAGH
jgi:prevent-host-death family protein